MKPDKPWMQSEQGHVKYTPWCLRDDSAQDAQCEWGVFGGNSEGLTRLCLDFRQAPQEHREGGGMCFMQIK